MEKNITIDLEENTLEVIDIKYGSKKYLEIISKDNGNFNLQIKSKSFNIFNVLNLVEV